MQNTKQTLRQVYGIYPSVLFRVSTQLASRGPAIGIHVKNLKDDSMYEFTDRGALLWLNLDGVRSVDAVIHRCQKIGKIKSKNFVRTASRFIESLAENGLIFDKTSNPQLDSRSQDMKGFIKLILTPPRAKVQKKNKILPKVNAETGDRAQFLKAQQRFAGLSKCNIRFKLRRASPSEYNGKLQIITSDIFLSGKKIDLQGSGASLSVENSACAAMGEVLERVYGFSQKSAVKNKSFNDLLRDKQNALDPESFKFYASDQESVLRGELSNYSRQTKMNWSWFGDALKNDQKVLIPSEISGGLLPPNEPMRIEATSSGCATATDEYGAKLRAILELIERDGLLYYWRTQNSPKSIDLSHAPDRIRELLELLGDDKKKITAFYLKSEFSSVTVQTTFLGNPSRGEPRFLSNCATKMDTVSALEKALIELLYVRSGLKNEGNIPKIFYGRNFDNSIWEFGDRSNFYCCHPAKEAYSFLFPKKSIEISWADIPQTQIADPQKNLEVLISEFKRNGLRLFLKNFAPHQVEKAGFWVCRAFSPELIAIEGVHRNRQLGSPRHYSLASVLNLKQRPKNSSQLSTWPHPLP